jgi:hypothetical protein
MSSTEPTIARLGGARAAEAGPRHGWPASLFILLSNLAALGLGLWASLGAIIAAAGVMRGASWEENAELAALGAAGAVAQWLVARSLKRFNRWGWYGAMAELGYVALSYGMVLVEYPAAPLLIVYVAVSVLWMRYFWQRRADFNVEFNYY